MHIFLVDDTDGESFFSAVFDNKKVCHTDEKRLGGKIFFLTEICA